MSTAFERVNDMTETALRHANDSALRAEAERHLQALAGPQARLREDQWSAISALAADRRRVLVVQRTGWGKSAVYFIATALLRARGAGPAVIVSPLLALMRNQIEAAARAGIHARTINSSNTEEWVQVYAGVRAGAVDVLLVSPERLNNPEFRDHVLPRLTEAAGLIVIDEAHCISDWGHDFRPDYRRIRRLVETLPRGIPVLATTATANARVAHDVAEQFHAGAGDDVLVLRGPLDRESLRVRLVDLADRAGARVLGAYEWGLGEKTRKANAALAGLGTTRRILISDTMLADYTDDEIEVVLAHELGHHVHGDLWKGILFESALILAGLYVAARVLDALAPVIGLTGSDDVAGMPALVLATGVVSFVMLPLAHAMSRAFERSADRFALALTRNPAAFVSAMRRLAAQNLAEERPSRLVQMLFYSHPPVRERIAAAQVAIQK